VPKISLEPFSLVGNPSVLISTHVDGTIADVRCIFDLNVLDFLNFQEVLWLFFTLEEHP
jgi:hypothetical protein